MILTKLEDLKKDKFYLLYDSSEGTKVLLIFHTTGDLTDSWADGDYDKRFDVRWCIDGTSYAEYFRIYDDNAISLDVTDPDNYDEGFIFQDKDTAIFWELTDSELAVHTINHL